MISILVVSTPEESLLTRRITPLDAFRGNCDINASDEPDGASGSDGI